MPTTYCRHIRTNGRRCQGLALRNRAFCYFHLNVNARHRALNPPTDGTANILDISEVDPDRIRREPLLSQYFEHTRGPLQLDFPTLEDRESIQISLSMLLKALGHNRIDSKRAATMLYGLQVASSNAARLQPETENLVTETVLDESIGLLAPDEDPKEVLLKAQLQASLLASVRSHQTYRDAPKTEGQGDFNPLSPIQAEDGPLAPG